MSSAPRIAVVVVSFERGELTQRCIDSIRAETKVPFHLYVVDNGSTGDETRGLLDKWDRDSDVTLVRLPENLGPAAGRNQALQLVDASYSHIAMLDNDIIALPGWDRAAIAALETEFDLIQPKLLERDLKLVERGPNVERPGGMDANPHFIGRGVPRDAEEVNVQGPCAIVGSGIMRKEVYEKVGELDARLHIGEDFDYSFRARELGFRLGYVPACELVHDHQFDYNYDQERGRVDKYLTAHLILWRKHGRVLLSPAYLCWYLWLHFHGEPMYLAPGSRWRTLHRRIFRRWGRWQCMKGFGSSWSSREVADKECERLESRFSVQ